MTTASPQPFRKGAHAAHVASLVIAFAMVTWFNRRGWFRGDEWDFITHYDLSRHPLDVFLPHNEHLSTVPLLLYKAILLVSGLGSYLPFVLILAVAHIVTGHLLWRLSRRAGAHPWVCTGAVATFLAVGGGFFNATAPFQVSFIGSTAFGLGILLVLDVDPPLSRSRVGAAWSLALSAMLCSGLGLIFTLVAAVFAMYRHGRRATLNVVSAPILFYATWYLVVGRHHVAALGLVGKSAYLELPDFVWRGLTGTFEGATGMGGAGAVLLLALAGYLLWRTGQDPRPRLATSLALGAGIFFLAIAPGRLVFGPDYATQSRYVYEGWAILVVPVAVALSTIARAGRAPQLAVLTVLALITIRNASEFRLQATRVDAATSAARARILTEGRLLRDGAPVLVSDDQPADINTQAGDLDVGGLRRLVREGVLPVSDVRAADDTSTLAARLQLELTVAVSGRDATGRVVAERAVGVSSTPGGNSCSLMESIGPGSRIWLPQSAALAFTLTSLQGGTLQVSLASAADPSVFAAGAPVHLARHQRVEVATNTPGSVLVISLPAGATEACGLVLPGP